MVLQYLNNNTIYLKYIKYNFVTRKIIYYFEVNGKEKSFITVAKDVNGVKFVESTEELEDFLMSLMNIDPYIFKKLSKITWDYIDNKNVNFPVFFNE